MCKMAEAVPLCTGLRVEVVYVVISYILRKCLDLMLERLAMERRRFGNVEREVDGDDFSSLNLFTGGCNAGRRQKVQSADVVIVSPYPSGLIWSTWDDWKVLSGRKDGAVGIPWDCLDQQRYGVSLRD